MVVSSICSYGVPKFGGGALGSWTSSEMGTGGFSSYGGGASASAWRAQHAVDS